MLSLDTERFAIRAGRLADAEAIARVYTSSWQTSYRGILPDSVLDRMDIGQRVASRRMILQDPSTLTLVAYDTTRGTIVGFCDAGPSRRPVRWTGEVYAIYFEHHAKRFGLGRAMFEQVRPWLRGRELRSMIVWVLENNPHAQRFYEALGGRRGPRLGSSVAGYPVVELGYVWDSI